MNPPSFAIRWADPGELRTVAHLSARIFDSESEPTQSWITRTVEDVASGRHPQADPADYAVAVDLATERIVGAAVLFKQPWRFGDTVLVTGRPEIVVTAATHRGSGVMRGVLDLLHERSAERGHLAQSITGVPGVYRHLGYQYTHPLGDGRVVRVTGVEPGERGSVRFARLAADESDEVAAVLRAARPRLSVTTPQSSQYLTFGANEQNPASLRGLRTVAAHDVSGAVIAVFQLAHGGTPYVCRVLAAAIASSANPLAVFRAFLSSELAADEGAVLLALGEDHELYDVAEALGYQSDRYMPDRWYFRIPDVEAFLAALRPELDTRLAGSPFRRYTGALVLQLRPAPITLRITDGVVDGIDAGGTARVGEQLAIRSESVPAVLTGAASIRELMAASPETYGSRLAVALADVLFPRLQSRTLPLD